MTRYICVGMVAFLLSIAVACQAQDATPTLQPGEVEVPFETLVLNGEGSNVVTPSHQLFAITDGADVTQLQPLMEPEAYQQIQEVDFSNYSIIALFRVPGRGCAGYGVTVERLVLRESSLTVSAHDWEPIGGTACSETTLSAFHVVKVHKETVDLARVNLLLQNQRKERKERLQRQL